MNTVPVIVIATAAVTLVACGASTDSTGSASVAQSEIRATSPVSPTDDATPSQSASQSEPSIEPTTTTPSETPTPSPTDGASPYLAIDAITLERSSWRERPFDDISGFSAFDEDFWGSCNILYAIRRLFNASPGSTSQPGYPRFINRAESLSGVDYLAGSEDGGKYTEVQIREIEFSGPKRAKSVIDRIRAADERCSKLDISTPNSVAAAAGIEDKHTIRFKVTGSNSDPYETVDWRVDESWFYKNDSLVKDDTMRAFGTALQFNNSVLIVRVFGENDDLNEGEATRVIDFVTRNYEKQRLQ